MSPTGRQTERRADDVLVCTVRGCGERLALRDGAFVCARGHTFDLAREGYVNVLQPTDRRSLAAGDTQSSVAARARMHERGLLHHVTTAVVAALVKHTQADGATFADLGCGSGHVLAASIAAGRDRAVGLDLSTHATRAAARTAEHARIVACNVDRGIPIASSAVDALISVFGPKPVAECARVLRPGGTWILAVPGDNDLIELRELATGTRRLEDRSAAALAALGTSFTLVARERVEARHELDAQSLADVGAASYRVARHAEQRRVEDVERLAVTLSADVLVVQRA